MAELLERYKMIGSYVAEVISSAFGRLLAQAALGIGIRHAAAALGANWLALPWGVCSRRSWGFCHLR